MVGVSVMIWNRVSKLFGSGKIGVRVRIRVGQFGVIDVCLPIEADTMSMDRKAEEVGRTTKEILVAYLWTF